MSDVDAPLVLHPYLSDECRQYAEHVAPAAFDYRPRADAKAALHDYANLLRANAVNIAARQLHPHGAPTVELGDALPAPRHALLVDPPSDGQAPPTGDLDTRDYLNPPIEDTHYSIDRKGRRQFHWYIREDDSWTAVDADNRVLTDGDGEPIAVDRAGRDVNTTRTARGALGRLRTILGSDGSTAEPAVDAPQIFDENGAPIENFAIPKVGRSAIVTSRVRGGKVLTAICALSGIVLAAGLVVGVVWGRSAVPAQGTISSDEASTYRLTDFPLVAMASFGQQYLTTCLTHGDATQVKARSRLLASMTTGGVSDSCGWSEGGTVQAPQMISYTGRAKPVGDGFNTGAAAYLYFNVSMQSGKFLTVSVPIWVNSKTEPNDLSVIGDIGFTAGLRNAKPESYTPASNTDEKLAADLQQSILAPFLSAWGSSNSQQLALTIAADALPDARLGLNNDFTKPEIKQVVIYTDRVADDTGTITYAPGDVVIAAVTVNWQVPQSDSTQTAGYRIGLRYDAGQWRVTDIGGGAVTAKAADDTRGGIALNDTPEDDTTATPVPSASESATPTP